MLFKATGIWHKSPTSRSTPEARWWLVLDLVDDLGKYYRHLYNLAHRAGGPLLRPAWHEHITVVRNEEPANKIGWHAISPRPVPFLYSNIVEGDENHVWLPVWCDEALGLRTHLGLSRDPYYPLHLTIGVVPRA